MTNRKKRKKKVSEMSSHKTTQLKRRRTRREELSGYIGEVSDRSRGGYVVVFCLLVAYSIMALSTLFYHC